MTQSRDRRFAAAAALAAGVCHLPSLAASFQFDDYSVIVGDPAAQSWGAWLRGLGTGARPLLKASYALCWAAGGGGPLAFHAFNAGVHALNAALLYLIGRRLCARWLPEERAAAAALAAALLFALHPAQTEAVTYACGRSQSLMAAFYLGGLLCYLRGSSLAAAALLCAGAAVKETALTLPAALLLVDAAVHGPHELRRAARRQAPVWAAAGLVLVVMLATARYRQILGYGFTQRGAAQNALTQLNGVWYLLARLVTLRGYNIDPGLPVLAAWTPALALKAAALACGLALALLASRRRPELGFGALWFFLQLAPTNSVVPRLDPANDRQLYLACWGPFLALAVTTARSLSPRIARAAAAAALAAFAAVSVRRQLDYRTEVSLWESSARLNPGNARAHNNLGIAYQEAGRAAEAREQYRAALLLQPGYLKAAVNLRLLEASP